MSITDRSSFSEPLNRTDALYFTTSTFATVGFGDITPVSQLARAVVSVQMIADLGALLLSPKLPFSRRADVWAAKPNPPLLHHPKRMMQADGPNWLKLAGYEVAVTANSWPHRACHSPIDTTRTTAAQPSVASLAGTDHPVWVGPHQRTEGTMKIVMSAQPRNIGPLDELLLGGTPCLSRISPRAQRPEQEEILRLRAEVARLQRERDEAREAPAKPSGARPGLARRIVAIVLVVLTAVLAFAAVPALYLRSEVIDTDRYVATVAPLASDPAIQAEITDKVTQQITDAVDFETITRDALNELSKTAPRVAAVITGLAPVIAEQTKNLIHTAVSKFVATPQFQGLWVQVNRVAHQGLVNLATGNTGGTVKYRPKRDSDDLHKGDRRPGQDAPGPAGGRPRRQDPGH